MDIHNPGRTQDAQNPAAHPQLSFCKPAEILKAIVNLGQHIAGIITDHEGMRAFTSGHIFTPHATVETRLAQWVQTAPREEQATRASIQVHQLHGATLEHGRLVLNNNLDLEHCSNLTALPAFLTINGFLDVSYCERLTVPRGLIVNGDMYTMGCPNRISDLATQMSDDPNQNTRVNLRWPVGNDSW